MATNILNSVYLALCLAWSFDLDLNHWFTVNSIIPWGFKSAYCQFFPLLLSVSFSLTHSQPSYTQTLYCICNYINTFMPVMAGSLSNAARWSEVKLKCLQCTVSQNHIYRLCDLPKVKLFLKVLLAVK